MQVGGRQDVPSTLSRTSFWSRPAALRASHMYVPESAGCARASCSVWVPAGGGGVSPSHQQLGCPQTPSLVPTELDPKPQFTHQAGGTRLLPGRGPGRPCTT